MPDDWRLEHLRTQPFLRGVPFKRKSYKSPRPGWDHDHCSFGQRHISVPLATDDAEAVDRGYVTDANYHGVCATCFGDFREKSCLTGTTHIP